MNTKDRESLRKVYFENLFTWLQDKISLDAAKLKSMSFLDFGSGSFGYTALYKEKFGRAIGLDIHDYSNFYSKDIEFVISDGVSIPVESHSLDLVISHSVLEHVTDLEKSISEINRILKIGGHCYLTVSPLYFAPTGSHIGYPKRLENWEHLDPSSEYYMIDGQGQLYLNKLTISKFLQAVATVPWNIVCCERKIIQKTKPNYLVNSDIMPMDLFTREFRFLGRKICEVGEQGAVYKTNTVKPNTNTVKPSTNTVKPNKLEDVFSFAGHDLRYFYHIGNCGFPPDPRTERTVELAIGDKWLSLAGKDVVEIGAVSCFYWRPLRVKRIIDPFDKHPNVTDRVSMMNVDFRGEKILSISTIEHIGNFVHENNQETPETVVKALDKIIDQSPCFLITFPAMYNRFLDRIIFNKSLPEDVKTRFIVRQLDQTWKEVYDPELAKKPYGKTFRSNGQSAGADSVIVLERGDLL